MTFSPWLVLFLAVPILLLGEWCVKRFAALRRFNIPAPVVGGLLVCLVVFGLNFSGLGKIVLGTRVNDGWWTWLVCAEPEWASRPMRPINTLFMVGFFSCVGLNATWSVVRSGGRQLVIFWVVASLFAVLQNVVGAGVSVAMGESPLLGMMCGSVTLSGGHSTAQAFAEPFQLAGLQGAAVIGVAAATFGLIAGALLGGPIATRLIEKHKLKSPEAGATGGGGGPATSVAVPEEPGFFVLLRALSREGFRLVATILVLFVCLKGGAWAAYLAQKAGVIFPVSMAGMLVGVIVRNAHDALGLKWLDSDVIDAMAALLLSIFLVITMAGLNLVELAATALPMFVILVVQIALMGVFAIYVTFRAMGRDYDAAVMAAGHCGFGLGATSNAMATMLAVVQRHGPARRAFLIVPPTGALLIDVTNGFMLTGILTWMT
ncbi:MAG: sodium/glutamate symporter [Verrucomicrobiota bacterium]